MSWLRHGLAEHEGWPVPLAGDPLTWFGADPTPPLELGASYGPDLTVDGRPHTDVTGWRAGCACGWRGDLLPRDVSFHGELWSDDGYPPPYVAGYTEAQWAGHADRVEADLDTPSCHVS